MTTFLMPPDLDESADAAPQDAADGPADPDAPYGRKPDGTPYRQSPEQRAAFGQRMAAARAAASSGYPAGIKPGQRLRHKAPQQTPPRAPRATPKPPKADPVKMGAETLIMGLSAGLMAGSKLGMPSLALDGFAIQHHGANVASALVEASAHAPRLAAWLEGLGSIGGPYALVAVAVAPLVAQLAVNHGWLKAGIMGTVTPEQLFATVSPDAYAAANWARAQDQADREAAEQLGDDDGVSDTA